jgi:hypothetical protein
MIGVSRLERENEREGSDSIYSGSVRRINASAFARREYELHCYKYWITGIHAGGKEVDEKPHRVARPVWIMDGDNRVNQSRSSAPHAPNTSQNNQDHLSSFESNHLVSEFGV